MTPPSQYVRTLDHIANAYAHKIGLSNKSALQAAAWKMQALEDEVQSLKEALEMSEAFISGFEGCDAQENMEVLTIVRRALPNKDRQVS